MDTVHAKNGKIKHYFTWHNTCKINNSSTEAKWLSNASRLISQGPLLADMLKYNSAGCNITPSRQMNGRIRQDLLKYLPCSLCLGETVHNKSSRQSFSLLCHALCSLCGFLMCLYHQALFSWSCLTHNDVADDVEYQAQSLSSPFDFSPTL